ncbi:hypothetical protein MMIC_P2350 [Mariprofundus micogutta]|uniref:Uncharacterized protein n=1 Tax=Mariprofundus micogutta TaxID=1921010 RepID=A0A1L8CR16_9PROT|nr:hypothetical protein [Mariprofundus micogutta]GAV21366.1 hypothetical protein MMIC_P2350 [Mariprofundus micogutta]
MSEEKIESTTTEEAPVENTSEEKSCKDGSCCRPHTSLYIAIIALLLSAYAAVTAATGGSANLEQRVTSLDNKVADIDNQLINLGKDVQSNRESLIQTKLKKAILNLQEIGNIAESETKSTIAEVEKMLQALTSAGGESDAADTTAEPAATDSTPEAAPVEETVTEPAADTAPAESVAPETPAAEATAPVEETVTEPAADAAPAESVAPETPAAEATAPAAESEVPTGPQAF